MSASEDVIITIRDGNEADLPTVLDLVKELAEFEDAGHKVSAKLSDYQKGFEDGLFKFLVATIDDDITGLMLYYDTWSTWKGKMLHLEDFIVRKAYRRQGIGMQMMQALTRLAREQGYCLIKWQVLNWNETGISFYEKMGNAVFDKEWWDVKVYL